MAILDPKEKAEWVAALRSGKYKQGRTALCEKKGDEWVYCCLGVKADIDGVLVETNNSRMKGWVEYEEMDNGELIRGYQKYLYTANNEALAQKPSGKKDNEGNAISYVGVLLLMNDVENNSFEEIADYIEKHL